MTFEVLYADHYVDFDDAASPLHSHINSDKIHQKSPSEKVPVSMLGALDNSEELISYEMKFPVSRFVGNVVPIQQWFYLWRTIAQDFFFT